MHDKIDRRSDRRNDVLTKKFRLTGMSIFASSAEFMINTPENGILNDMDDSQVNTCKRNFQLCQIPLNLAQQKPTRRRLGLNSMKSILENFASWSSLFV